MSLRKNTDQFTPEQLTILVLDDDEDDLDLTLLYLEGLDTRLCAYTRAGEALANLEIDRPDLMMVDIKMAEMDGFTFIKQVHEVRPGLPFVMVTGSSALEDSIRAIRAGAQNYVTKPFNREILQQSVGKVIDNIQTSRLNDFYLKELKRRDREIDLQLGLARNIQQFMVPRELPNLKNGEVALRFEPCDDIGGDFIDLRHSPGSDTIELLLADISGHGIPAALLASMLKTLVHEIFSSGGEPDQMMVELNNRLYNNFSGGNFAAAIYCRVNTLTGEVYYINCGCEKSIMLQSDGRADKIISRGRILAFEEAVQPSELFTPLEFILKPGDSIYLFTDGVTEVTGTNGKMLGLDGLTALIEETRTGSVNDSLSSLYSSILQYSRDRYLEDDFTLAAVRL